jgi:serine/threonine protein kinase
MLTAEQKAACPLVLFRRTIHGKTLSAIVYVALTRSLILIHYTWEMMTPGVGSPIYLAPETNSASAYTGTVDIDSLASILEEVLISKPAFPATTTLASRRAKAPGLKEGNYSADH